MAAAEHGVTHGEEVLGGVHAGGHVAPTEALLFVLTCVCIGLCVQCFLGKLVKLPYTALLLIIGLAIGLLQAVPNQPAAFTATLSQWMSIDPHLLLLIFLPTIGFSAGIAQEPHLLRKNWGQILILAWPGVVVCFLLIAICGKFFFPYGWSWPESLLFGAMLSATDPVAVVAVLHEVGADEKLANVIDGESLVNDGSALVIFLVLQQFVQGATLSPGEIVVLFLRLALLGAAMGVAFSMATSFWLSRLFNDPGTSIVLTFGAAYSCYFVSEELLGASGLLAVVVMGFSMSLMGGRQIAGRIQTEMHAFWQALEWLANTILFTWVGIVLGMVLLEPASPLLQSDIRFSHHIKPVDAGYCVVLYLWLVVARTVAIGVFFPLLRTGRVGYAMTWKTWAVMVWAGLRGAVGVAMSLFIVLDNLIKSDDYKAHCIFFMAVMAFATVLINGSTTKYLLRGLGLLKMSPQQQEVLERVLKEVVDIRSARLAAVQPSPVLGSPDPAVVKAWTSVGAVSALAATRRTFHRRNALAAASSGKPTSRAADAAAAAVGGQGLASQLAEYRTRLLHVVKATYGSMFAKYEMSTGSIQLLQEVTDEAVDAARLRSPSASSSSSSSLSFSRHAKPADAAADAAEEAEAGKGGAAAAGEGLCDWRLLRAQLDKPGLAGRLEKLVGPCGGVALSRHPLAKQAAAKLQLVAAFVGAHTTAQQVVDTHLAEKLHDGAADDDAAAPDRQAARLVLQESQAEVVAATEYAHTVLLPAHPELGRLLMSKLVSIGILEEQLDFLSNIQGSGLIRGEEVHSVEHQVAHKLEHLQHQRFSAASQDLDRHGAGRASPADASGSGKGAAADGAGAGGEAGAGPEARLGRLESLNYMAPLRQASSAAGGLHKGSTDLRRRTCMYK